MRPISDSDLQNGKIMNLDYLGSLSLWSLVTAATGNSYRDGVGQEISVLLQLTQPGLEGAQTQAPPLALCLAISSQLHRAV